MTSINFYKHMDVLWKKLNQEQRKKFQKDFNLAFCYYDFLTSETLKDLPRTSEDTSLYEYITIMFPRKKERVKFLNTCMDQVDTTQFRAQRRLMLNITNNSLWEKGKKHIETLLMREKKRPYYSNIRLVRDLTSLPETTDLEKS